MAANPTGRILAGPFPVCFPAWESVDQADSCDIVHIYDRSHPTDGSYVVEFLHEKIARQYELKFAQKVANREAIAGSIVQPKAFALPPFLVKPKPSSIPIPFGRDKLLSRQAAPGPTTLHEAKKYDLIMTSRVASKKGEDKIKDAQELPPAWEVYKADVGPPSNWMSQHLVDTLFDQDTEEEEMCGSCDGHPSVGSIGHFQGSCSPCRFHQRDSCKLGENCGHCHYEHTQKGSRLQRRNQVTQIRY